MKRLLLLLAGVVLLAASGCDAQTQPELDGNLLCYDLGEGTLSELGGREIPYEIQGVLGIPAEKNCPVVVLIHGAHAIEKASETHYEQGFNYLAQALSEQGNLVISMNVAINYSFEDGEPYGNERTRQVLAQQLALLKQAVDGDETVFGFDLTGAGDFSKIVLMGHSRGGMDVLECAESMPQGMRLAGVICVAPAQYKEMETSLPNVPVGIVLPQLDGDVISLDGSDFFEQFVEDANYTETVELIDLKWANHGQFNTLLTQPDLNSSEADLARLMPAEQQRGFLTQYCIDFVKSVTTTGAPVFSSASELASRAYDCDVLLRVYSGTGRELWSAQDGAAPVCDGAVSAQRQIASYLPAENTVESFRLPGSSSLKNYALERIAWTGEKAGVTVPFAQSAGELRFVDLDLAIDSTDPDNVKGQSMTLTFWDADGTAEEYFVDSGAAALLWQEGELVEQIGWDGQLAQEYSTFTPLVTLRIDLSNLSAVDSGRLTGVTLSWNSPRGSLMLRSIRAVPAA